MVKIQNKRRSRSGVVRRTRRRSTTFSPNKSVYGPVLKNIKMKYTAFRTIDVTTALSHGLIGFRIALGNDTIFSGPNAFYSNFHEFRVLHATAVTKCTHQYYVENQPSSSLHHNLHYASRMVTILRDHDSGEDDAFKSFGNAVSSPGSRHTTFTNHQVGTIRNNWVPTEPSDANWRLTSNDGVFYIYVFINPPTGSFSDHWLTLSYNVEVHVTFHISVRAVDFKQTSSTVHTVSDCISPSIPDGWIVMDTHSTPM